MTTMVKTHSFQIWQVKDGQVYARERYTSLKDRKTLGLPVKKSHYRMVWASSIDGDEDMDALNALYEQFNVYAPADFRGRLMSVSDVIVLDGSRAYYCDPIGWGRLDKWED